MSGTTDGMPERDLRRPCKEGASTLNKCLDVRLLHVRPQENLLTWPMLDQCEARWVACILEHGDAAAIWLGRHRADLGRRATLKFPPDAGALP